MAEQKKKKLQHPRIKPVKRAKGSPSRRTYQAVTASASLSAGLGLPPLKMVLVHAQNDRANAASKPISKSKTKGIRSKEEAVIKIIEHLIKAK
jgi:hypothetical protein